MLFNSSCCFFYLQHLCQNKAPPSQYFFSKQDVESHVLFDYDKGYFIDPTVNKRIFGILKLSIGIKKENMSRFQDIPFLPYRKSKTKSKSNDDGVYYIMCSACCEEQRRISCNHSFEKYNFFFLVPTNFRFYILFFFIFRRCLNGSYNIYEIEAAISKGGSENLTQVQTQNTLIKLHFWQVMIYLGLKRLWYIISQVRFFKTLFHYQRVKNYGIPSFQKMLSLMRKLTVTVQN